MSGVVFNISRESDLFMCVAELLSLKIVYFSENKKKLKLKLKLKL